MNLESKYKIFHSWKGVWEYRLRNGGHLLQRWVKGTVPYFFFFFSIFTLKLKLYCGVEQIQHYLVVQISIANRYEMKHSFIKSTFLTIDKLIQFCNACKRICIFTPCPLVNHYSDVVMGEIASQITCVSIVHSTFCSGADQRKYQSSASLAYVRGIHRWPVKSPHKGPVMRKMFPFDEPGNAINTNDFDNALTVHKHHRFNLTDFQVFQGFSIHSLGRQR